MALVTLFKKEAPSIEGVQFDAVLEDTLESNVELTGYTIEAGARAADHRIILPKKWTLTIAMSNNSLSPVTGLATGLLSNLTDSGSIATVAGLASGISSSEPTRSSAILAALIKIQEQGDPVDVDTVDYQLSNMVIQSIRRTKDPENENGLIAEVSMQELPTLDTVISKNASPSQSQLSGDDPSQTQSTSSVDKGEQQGESVSDAINDDADEVL